MVIANPLRPGVVTTDILANGAVTCVKTNFIGCTLALDVITLATSLTGGELKPTTPLAQQYGGTGITAPQYTFDADGNVIGNSGLAGGSAFYIKDSAGHNVAKFLLDGNDALFVDYGFSAYGWECGNGSTFKIDGAAGQGAGLTCDSSDNLKLLVGDNANNWKTVFTVPGSIASPTLTFNIPVAMYTPLPVTSGGTGTNAPALVAGSNITLSGSFPNQTVALNNDLTLSEVSPYINLSDTTSGYMHAIIRFQRAGSGVYAIGVDDTSGSNGVFYVYNYALSSHPLQINLDDTIDINKTFTTYNGNTLAGKGIPATLSQGNQTGINTSTAVGSFTAPYTGMYRLSVYSRVTAVNTSTYGFYASYYDAWASAAATLLMATIAASAAIGTVVSGEAMVYAEAGQTIQINCNTGGTPPTIDVAWSIEGL